VAPQRILPRQAQHESLDTRGGRRTAGPAPPARVVLPRRQPAVPGQERRGRDREHLGPAPACHDPCQRGEPGPVRRLVPHPADLPAQHRVLMPEHQHFGHCRLVGAEQHDDQAEYPAGQHVDDLEQHPPSQPSPCPACRQQCRSANNRVFERHRESLEKDPPNGRAPRQRPTGVAGVCRGSACGSMAGCCGVICTRFGWPCFVRFPPGHPAIGGRVSQVRPRPIPASMRAPKGSPWVYDAGTQGADHRS
jgi:hypothetical protein